MISAGFYWVRFDRCDEWEVARWVVDGREGHWERSGYEQMDYIVFEWRVAELHVQPLSMPQEPGTIASMTIADPDGKPNAFPETKPTVDILRAHECTLDVSAAVDEMFGARGLADWQAKHYETVRYTLGQAVKALVEHVPPCPDRSAAIRKLREAAWCAQAGIQFRGRY